MIYKFLTFEDLKREYLPLNSYAIILLFGLSVPIDIMLTSVFRNDIKLILFVSNLSTSMLFFLFH